MKRNVSVITSDYVAIFISVVWNVNSYGEIIGIFPWPQPKKYSTIIHDSLLYDGDFSAVERAKWIHMFRAFNADNSTDSTYVRAQWK